MCSSDLGPGPSEWEASATIKFKKQRPQHAGYYNCVWQGSYGGTSYGVLYWNGTEFGEWEYGRFNPVSKVDTWSGYSWDTSDWANQPAEPTVDLRCKNPKCGWVGVRDELREDEDYNDHCPKCDSTDVDWIHFDLDSKDGARNRELYCVPLTEEQREARDKHNAEALEVALQELKDEFDALMATEGEETGYDYKGQLGVDAECVQCSWKGVVDQLYYEDEFADGTCPECHEPVEFKEKAE